MRAVNASHGGVYNARAMARRVISFIVFLRRLYQIIILYNPEILRGRPRWCDRFGQYGIKVSFWGSGTLKIVIYVEN